MVRSDLLLAGAANGAGANPLTFVEVAMFIFIAIFLGLLIWVIFARRGAFNRVKQIPLEDDKLVTPRSGGGGDAKKPTDEHDPREKGN